MKYGAKIDIDTFTENPSEASQALADSFGGVHELLRYLSEVIDFIELGVIDEKTPAKLVLSAAEAVKAHSLGITIHGYTDEVISPEDFFAPYEMLFAAQLQDTYNVTVHPLDYDRATNEECTKFLSSLCNYADSHGCPVIFALENQRCEPDYSPVGLCRNVGKIITAVNSSRLYACFDFGHLYSNKHFYGDIFDGTTDEFIKYVRHTHIHNMYNGTTHFPLTHGGNDIKAYLELLSEIGFDGNLNLELDPHRYYGKIDQKAALIDSVTQLKKF